MDNRLKATYRGIALVDLLAVGAVLLVIAAFGLPTLERARELSKRAVCAINIKALGGAGEIYSDANAGQWMTPPFRYAGGSRGTFYMCDSPIVCIGYQRERQSTSQTPAVPSGGSTALTTTRAFWMLVRSGDAVVEQFVCPSSDVDLPDPTTSVDSYYDFSAYHNISYGYLVPFGPPSTRPRSGADNRVIFAADKGPFYQYSPINFMTSGPDGTPLEEWNVPRFWRIGNSPNHGGTRSGEGQNALHADGHVEFHRKPIAGADGDNIYTAMLDDWENPYGRAHGASPHQFVNGYYPYPGQWAFGPCFDCFSTTDSLIYP